jgi:uncharacterized protein YdaU (DUF1376 family)
MRTFLLTLSEESDPRNPRHSILAGPTHDYMSVREAFHAKNTDTEFAVVSLWDSNGGIIRKKRLGKEIAKASFKKSKSEPAA